MTDLHRTNINLFAADVAYLRKHYGWGWSEQVREAVASYVRNHRAVNILTDLGNKEISRRYVDNTEVPFDE